LALLCISGFRRGYNAVDDRTRQAMTTVQHDIDNLLGPDFSAAGMMQTRRSLVDLVHSLHRGDAVRAVQMNPIQAAGYSKLQVTTYPYLHGEIEKLLNTLRKPNR
jgi:hypothetical protein